MMLVILSIGCISEEEPKPCVCECVGSGETGGGLCMFTITVLDSRTQEPINGMPVRIAKVGTGYSLSTSTNYQGKVFINKDYNYDWITYPASYSVRLDNNQAWTWTYDITYQINECVCYAER